MLEEAEELHRKVGDTGGLRRILHLRGQHAYHALGDVARSRKLLREAADLSTADGDAFSAATSLHSLGDVALAVGDVDTAEADYLDALRVSWATGADRLVCYSIAGLAATAAARRDVDHAALLWGFVGAYEARLGFTLRWRSLYEERCAALADANRARYEEGQRLDVGAAVEIASAPAQA